MTLTPQGEENLKIVGKLNDRSGLSNEMADLCANHPIYRVTEDDADQNDNNQMSDPEDADDTDVAEMPGQSRLLAQTCINVLIGEWRRFRG